LSDQISRLERLFASLCDGDWEHGQGITIENLDNPGWTIRISLSGTRFAHLALPATMTERTEDDWIHVSIVRENHDTLLQCACGPRNLSEALDVVLDLLQ
jgi:hypothetical protein